ncbi:MAG: excinuclease ABC subunit UvrB [Rikenellaceae bacterium]
MEFLLESKYQPTGDQPEAINQIVQALESGVNHTTLEGVTGSGKTFTMANVIKNLNRPTLILSHNKTLAGQLYNEFKSFFPHNAVEFFVSYYDYYQPEAYIPQSDTYIEKDLAINDELDKLRLNTTSALISGRRDVIVISSVSCLYGLGNPSDFHSNTICLEVDKPLNRNILLRKLSESLYSRNDIDFGRGTFRVRGEAVDIYQAGTDKAYRVKIEFDTIESITEIDPITGSKLDSLESVRIFPANNFITTRERINSALYNIQDDLVSRMEWLEAHDKKFEAKRLKSRVEYDLEMIKEVGYCSGIENYSRYFDGRSAGTRPFCLLDYFPDDFVTIIDESHVTIPQVRGMYGGDFSRKTNLVDYGFRLPSALDNRPLKMEEFENLTGQILYVSATPAEYELALSEGVVVEQIIRPTGLLDPKIEVRPTDNQIDRIVEDIYEVINEGNDERVMVTTLTKRMAEELSHYFDRIGIRSRYVHSDIDTIERLELLDQYRDGVFDVLIGVNLLREGLDMPQVRLVIIMDADKEGFLRSHRSLTQTAGRAARNVNGKVIMYADRVTKSMAKTIDETMRRRRKQEDYNKEHNITPKQIIRGTSKSLFTREKTEKKLEREIAYDVSFKLTNSMVAETDTGYEIVNKEVLLEKIAEARSKMETAAKELDFATATKQRDLMFDYQKQYDALEVKN